MTHDLLNNPFDLILYGKPIDGITLVKDKLSRPLQELARETKADPMLAYIYGYSIGGQQYQTDTPPAFVVMGEGDDAKGWDKFKDDYQMWRVAITDPTICLDIMPGTFGELLLGPKEDSAEDCISGGTLIRGTDGRVYFILADLETFEVFEDETKSDLLLTTGAERLDLTIKTLSASGVMASRGVMAARGVMASRGVMAARGVMASRGVMAARGAMTFRVV